MNPKRRFLLYIILIPIVFIILVAIIITVNDVNNIKSHMNKHMHDKKNQFIQKNIKLMHNKVHFINEIIKYRQSITTANLKESLNEKIQEETIKQIKKHKSFKNRHLFILKLHNINGGKDFATVLLYNDKHDLVGKKIDDTFEDTDKYRFIKKYLKDLRAKGESYTKYILKKPGSDQALTKLSYIYHQKDWDWVIGSWFYFDDLDKDIAKMKSETSHYWQQMIKYSVAWTIIISIIMVAFAFLISDKLKRIIEKYADRLETNENKLKELNKSLEEKVEAKVKELRQKDNILVQQSKLASMGEMIGNIAHQWRQPLNILGTDLMNLEFKHENKQINDEFINSYIEKTQQTIKKMSETIDDFRNFFSPNKEKEQFDIVEVINETLKFLEGTFKNNNISIDMDYLESCYLTGYRNEFIQALLVIFNNSKDAIKQNNINNGKIYVQLVSDPNNIKIIIKDNGGGIPSDTIERVFEPYFTTKYKSQGTGIGLYMCKMIIENSMNGKINISNEEDGAKVEISFKLI